MRIISGQARGRRLRAPDTSTTRPATDRVREAVFSSLGSSVEGAAVADLYAGSGAYGLEALSRGADTVVFVENGRKALATLEANIETVGLGGAVVAGDVGVFLSRGGHRFDLVFMDPPWEQDARVMGEEMGRLDGLLADRATVVVSRRSTDPIPDPPKTWRVAADKRYGDTRILRYEKLKATHDHRSMPGQL
jgi:16S rRNA (guanine966-N2)-methyltransferase